MTFMLFTEQECHIAKEGKVKTYSVHRHGVSLWGGNTGHSHHQKISETWKKTQKKWLSMFTLKFHPPQSHIGL